MQNATSLTVTVLSFYKNGKYDMSCRKGGLLVKNCPAVRLFVDVIWRLYFRCLSIGVLLHREHCSDKNENEYRKENLTGVSTFATLRTNQTLCKDMKICIYIIILPPPNSCIDFKDRFMMIMKTNMLFIFISYRVLLWSGLNKVSDTSWIAFLLSFFFLRVRFYSFFPFPLTLLIDYAN